MVWVFQVPATLLEGDFDFLVEMTIPLPEEAGSMPTALLLTRPEYWRERGNTQGRVSNRVLEEE